MDLTMKSHKAPDAKPLRSDFRRRILDFLEKIARAQQKTPGGSC